MLRRDIAITGLILTALSLAALVIVEIRFADAVIKTASMPSEAFTGNRWLALANEVSRHKEASLILLLFSLAVLAASASLILTARQNKAQAPQSNAPCVHSENFGKVSSAYRELLMRYQGLMEINQSALIELDLDGNITYLNGPARKLTGRPEDGRTLGSPFAQFLTAENSIDLYLLLDDIRHGNTVKNRQLPFMCDDGGVNKLNMSGAPVWSEGMVRGFLISIHDTDKAERLAMELEDAKQAAMETAEQLKTTMLDIEEFALLAVKREVKMQEIREKLKKFKEHQNEGIVH